MTIHDEKKLMRRVAGYHDLRMDGMLDLVVRAKNRSVFDVGCNRGLVAFEMANNGATLCHGIDNYEEGIQTARHLFADLRSVSSQFVVGDLTKGPSALSPFAFQRYDIVLMLATYHKLKRIMEPGKLAALMQNLTERTQEWFAWRATSDKPSENEEEMRAIDRICRDSGLTRVHTSYMSETLGLCAVWARR